MLTVATKMIIQILPDSWILRVACNTVDPYTLPASHHIFFRINGIIKCDRNIKYSRAALGSNFEIRVVSDGPFSATSAGNGTPAQQHSYFEYESAHTLILRSMHILKD